MSESKLKQGDLVSFAIENGANKVETSVNINEIVVLHDTNKIPWACLRIEDGNPASQDFEQSSSKSFGIGEEIVVKAGYDSKNEPIFKGIVVGHKVCVRKGKSFLEILCKDKAIAMTKGRKSAYFKEKKDNEIIAALGDESGVKASADPTDVKHPMMVQHNSTDWDFLLARADANGLPVVVKDGELSAKKPKLAGPVAVLSFGDNIIEFDGEVNGAHELKKVTALSWDPDTKKIKKGDGKSSGLKHPGNVKPDELLKPLGKKEIELKHGGQLTDIELKAWANAVWQRSELGRVRGRVKIEGSSTVNVGDTVELKGLGERLNGNAWVSGVRHELNSGNWFTDIQLGLSPEMYVEDNELTNVPAGGVLSGVSGLQVGIVTNIHEDPDAAFRIQVKMPLVDLEGEGVWARYAPLTGHVFLPQKEEEVLVGFLNDDPRFPIVLGTLYGKKLPIPETLKADEKNSLKGFVTYGEIHMLIDDENKTLEIATPGKNTIRLDDKEKAISIIDQHKNKFVLNKDGISIESAKDLSIKAPSGALKFEGKDVEIKSSAATKIEGGAGLNLETGATAVLKGSLVQIN